MGRQLKSHADNLREIAEGMRTMAGGDDGYISDCQRAAQAIEDAIARLYALEKDLSLIRDARGANVAVEVRAIRLRLQDGQS